MGLNGTSALARSAPLQGAAFAPAIAMPGAYSGSCPEPTPGPGAHSSQLVGPELRGPLPGQATSVCGTMISWSSPPDQTEDGQDELSPNYLAGELHTEPLPPPLLAALPLPHAALHSGASAPAALRRGAYYLAAPHSGASFPGATQSAPLPIAAPPPTPLPAAAPLPPPPHQAVHRPPFRCAVLLRLPPLHAVKVSPPQRAAAACHEPKDARCGGAPCAKRPRFRRGQPLALVDFKQPRVPRPFGPASRHGAPQSQTRGQGLRPAYTPR